MGHGEAFALAFAQDFDSPNQAVIERVNSLLENDPTFSLSEDFARFCLSIHVPSVADH